MLSGLILLVIVGAWLAVLVPMALRSHDSSSSLSSVDRFSDAMRVLSRREGSSPGSRAGSRAVVVPPRPATATSQRGAARGPLAAAPTVPLAVRRRRTLVGLLAATAVGLLGSLVAGALLWLAGLTLLLAVAFVVHCRRQALLAAERAERTRRRAAPRPVADRRRQHEEGAAPPRRTAVPVQGRVPVAAPAHVAGVPSRMPSRPAPLSAPLPAPAARHDEPVPAAALGSAWSPVPVPVPTYVTKPVAPPRRPRVLDLTKPGEWSATLETDDAGLDILGDRDELDGILERQPHRRAVGD